MKARDEGVTMIELIVTMAIASVLMAIGMWSIRGSLIADREVQTVDQVRSSLRNAEENALSQGRTYCVYFTASTWATYKSDCTVTADRTDGPYTMPDSTIQFTGISFPAPVPAITGLTTNCPVLGRCAYFYPRGTALAGGLQVTRPGKTHSISVEGLTGRVSAT